MKTLSVDAAINELASRTCSVVHARDLRALGIERHHVHRRVSAGGMAPMLKLTYGVGPQCHSPTFEMRCMAGVLAAGPGAGITGNSAATLLDVWTRGDGSVHVTAPGRGPHDPPPGYHFHRTGLLVPDSPFAAGSIPVVSFVDMCVAMARTSTKWQLASIICRGIYLRLVTLAELEQAVQVRARCPWVTVLRGAIELVRAGSAGTRSASEDLLLAMLLEAGVPEPIVNTRAAHGIARDEPDFLFMDAALNVEVDGGHHDQPAQAADDAERDGIVEARGIRVIRVRARDVWRKGARVVRAIRAALDGCTVECDERRYLKLT